MYRWEITRAALAQRVIATVRSDSYDRAAETAGTLLSAGFTSLEISLATPFGLEAVATLVREAGDEAVIGAGAVLDAASARLAVEAGARFLASPVLDAEVVRTGHRYGIPVLPGVATPAEIVRALELGADALKFFPAAGHRPAVLRDIRAELPQAALVPCGDLDVEAVPEWIAAGAVACSPGPALAEGDRDAVAKRAEDLLARLAEEFGEDEEEGEG
ncbi:2-dehydro-3-deoxyphosphogluconate aldolase [Streptomyces sp. AV19]|uniref:bifunctional 4-hydroxy-2-oxoglutarate aldolase/2-dehydro-3-deoxy-phosphogluconate aldolase n=1 Tax=Streptomyces sp. AV19 TaxID=2793068 RepID=UPI0018FEE293|nr:2-dehydro-3-deoxyphosphogluconate aldolase [Streptomyces sp. AV19]MBH1938343.1 2-dehydro-3-deoxyphosphogluconate aldolase [Streptomyces sp. AV19]MDG4534992.1 2-dehydro-3-deoxyphosphogluconate aldolase [Streptomyces sp. AV19]